MSFSWTYCESKCIFKGIFDNLQRVCHKLFEIKLRSDITRFSPSTAYHPGEWDWFPSKHTHWLISFNSSFWHITCICLCGYVVSMKWKLCFTSCLRSMSNIRSGEKLSQEMCTCCNQGILSLRLGHGPDHES